MIIDVPFVMSKSNTEYELEVAVEGDNIEIVDVKKYSNGSLVSENIKRFKRKLGKSDWRLIEDAIKYHHR